MTESNVAPVAVGGSGRGWKMIAGAIVLVLAAGWLLLYATVGGDFYMTVGELGEAGDAANVRVGGQVVPDSVTQMGDTATFTIRDESGAALDVVYTGAFPERLRSYEYVVATGSVQPGGPFEAVEVLVKCPDKLFAEKLTNGVLGGVGLERVLY
ncbi:MAG: cytochrome c maturation protein CcmE [Actinobacteria bacterium]|nr:cytochrome c maturation protein CcmE [Actinomycetota bacterium]